MHPPRALRAPHAARAPHRRGLTIAEALVALTILTVGVLALLGTTTRLARDEGDALAAESAARLVADRVELLTSAPCADTSGVRVARGFVERWRSARTDDVTFVFDTVRHLRPGIGRVTTTLAGAVRCAP